jgi:hypothetical protein
MRYSLLWDVSQPALLFSYCLTIEDGTEVCPETSATYRYTLRNIPEERISQNKSFYFLVTEKFEYVRSGNHILIPYTPVASCIFFYLQCVFIVLALFGHPD